MDGNYKEGDFREILGGAFPGEELLDSVDWAGFDNCWRHFLDYLLGMLKLQILLSAMNWLDLYLPQSPLP